MGKKRIESFEKIKDDNQRKVTYCKRKKGLLKKTIELSLLCDLKCFTFIYDHTHSRVIHYASHPDENIMNLFNQELAWDYFTNKDVSI